MDRLKLTRSWGFPFYLGQNLSTETQTSHFNAQRKSLPEPKASSPSSLHCHPRSFHPPSSRHRAGESSAHRQSLPGSCCNNFHPMSSVKEKTKKNQKNNRKYVKAFFVFFLSKLNSPAPGEHLTQPAPSSCSFCITVCTQGALWEARR